MVGGNKNEQQSEVFAHVFKVICVFLDGNDGQSFLLSTLDLLNLINGLLGQGSVF